MSVHDALDVSSAGVCASPSSPSAARGDGRRLRWFAVLLAAAACIVGCGEDPQKKRAAYNEALRALEQDRITLKNLQTERERVYGEYQLHNFEGWFWAGNFEPRLLLGFSLGEDSFGNPTSLGWYFHRKLVKPWPLQIERLFSERGELLPWTEHTRGELYRRRITDRYARLLKDLDDRVSLQRERVRHADEYVQLLQPTVTE